MAARPRRRWCIASADSDCARQQGSRMHATPGSAGRRRLYGLYLFVSRREAVGSRPPAFQRRILVCIEDRIDGLTIALAAAFAFACIEACRSGMHRERGACFDSGFGTLDRHPDHHSDDMHHAAGQGDVAHFLIFSPKAYGLSAVTGMPNGRHSAPGLQRDQSEREHENESLQYAPDHGASGARTSAGPTDASPSPHRHRHCDCGGPVLCLRHQRERCDPYRPPS